MAKTPKSDRTPRGAGYRIALATSEFNPAITDAMRKDALRAIAAAGATVAADERAPGVYDLPLLVDTLLARPDVDAAVALGALVTGETNHDELIAYACAHALTQLSLRHRKPVGLGVTGPGQTLAQARARIDRAGWAVQSVCKQLQTLAALRRADARGA